MFWEEQAEQEADWLSGHQGFQASILPGPQDAPSTDPLAWSCSVCDFN